MRGKRSTDTTHDYYIKNATRCTKLHKCANCFRDICDKQYVANSQAASQCSCTAGHKEGATFILISAFTNVHQF